MRLRTKIFIFVMLFFMLCTTFLTYYSKIVFDKNLPSVTAIEPKTGNMQENGRYSFIIPSDCIRTDIEMRRYILSLREQNDVLGNNYTAQRIDISVISEQNGYSVIDGIYFIEPVITDSTIPIEAGCRVKLQLSQIAPAR